MLITHNREKLLQTIAFFSKNVNNLGKTKLFKLLYFLDFEHFKETGRSVTELEYSAWKMGPVPTSLYEELEQPEKDFAESIQLKEIPVHRGKSKMLTFTPLIPFNPIHFSKRELRIMNMLVERYKDANAEDMIEATHLERLPWHQIYEVEGKKQEKIPYELALLSQNRDLMKSDIIDRETLLEVLK